MLSKLFFMSGVYITLKITYCFPSFLIIRTSPIPSASRVLSFANLTLFFIKGMIFTNQSLIPLMCD